jgi:hypothetical protein
LRVVAVLCCHPKTGKKHESDSMNPTSTNLLGLLLLLALSER